MRWLLIIFTGLALMLSACSKIGGGEKIAVVNWERVLQEHPQYARLQKLRDEYNLLLDKRREQEIVGKTQMSGLARLYQLKRNSKQNFLSADFFTRLTEKQTEEQKKLKQLSEQIADQVDKELAEEEKKLNEHYQLRLFNLRLKLDTVRLIPEERKKLEAELKAVREARDRDRMLLIQHKMGLVNQRMQPHIKAMRQQLDAYARQLQGRDLHIARLSLPEGSTWGGKTLAQLRIGGRNGVHVAAIVRDHHRINVPGGGSMLFPHDVLEVVGDDQSIEQFSQRMNSEVFFAVLAATSAVFFSKYLKLRKRHELIIAIIEAVAAAAFLISWILQLVH